MSGCNHKGAPEVFEMAEESLRNRGISEEQWRGRRFGYGENVPDGPWKSIYIEVERRDGAWIATRLDRRNEILPDTEEGLRELA
ncbi:MAG: hypothetical protein WBX15_13655 [Thermoanaerobaculia bacterium]